MATLPTADDTVEVIEVEELTPEEEDRLAAEAEEARRAKEELLESLAMSVEEKFRTRATRRATKENQWLRAINLFYGKLAFNGDMFSRETPFELVNTANRPDVNIVRSKCAIAIAQTYSMQFGTGDKNWDLWADKGNTDPHNTVAADKMSAVIEEQLEDSKYTNVCYKGMRDRVIMGVAVLKGPASVGKQVRSYKALDGTSTWIPSLSVDYSPELVYVNPWFFYPDETTAETDELADTIEVHPKSALELKKLMQHEGFNAEALEKVLEKQPNEHRSSTWPEFAKITNNNPELYKNKFLVLEYHGPITRTQLDKLEIECSYDSLNDEYYGEVWVCEGEVIRVELEAIEASFRVPYYMSVWEKDPSSVFGFGVPLMMEDAQRVVNETWHMILDNSSMSSGAQVGMHKHLVEPANGDWKLGPNQIWYLTDAGTKISDAIQFFNVPNVTGQLVPILQMAQAFSEEESGIPLITAGLNSPEVGDTATGSLIVRQASTTLLDFMSEEWDNTITAPIISAWYGWNMQFNDDPEIKGQFQVDVRTSTQYKNKQIHIRDLEKLSVETAQNPEMAKWVKQDVLARMRLSLMTLPTLEVIKTEDEVLADEKKAAENAQPDPAMLELQLEARKIGVQEAELQYKIQSGMKQAEFDHEEKMTANQARLVESEARVAVSQNEKETEMLKLAQKSEATAASLMSAEKIARENNLTKAFSIGLADTRAQQENELFNKEIELKRDTGSGI
jgi:hypothetical protein